VTAARDLTKHVPRFVSRLASAAAVLVTLAGAAFAQQPDVESSIAAENATLSAQIADGARALDLYVRSAPALYVYQFTDTGTAASLAVGGTEFFKDPDLH